MSNFKNGEDPDEIPQNVAFHQICTDFKAKKRSSVIEAQLHLEMSTCDIQSDIS